MADFPLESLSSSKNVADPERWLSVVAGSAVAAYGLTRRSVPGIVIAALGGALVWRGATGHCMVYESLGVSTAPENGDNVSVPYGRGIRVEESIVVNRPRSDVYAFWRNFENLPQIMSHLESVRALPGANRTHWIAKGPAGANAEWDAEIINEVRDELIGWRSIDGSRVDNAGSVHFEDAPGGGTAVRVVLRYDPPAGVFGAAVAKLFGEDPQKQVREDLARFKEFFV